MSAEIAEARAVIAVMNAEIKRLRSVAGSSRVDLIDKLEAAEIALDAKDKRIAELEAGGWQDIETAPKDGHEFIACLPRQGGVRVLVRWDKLHACWLTKGLAISLFDGDLWHPLPAPPSLPNKEDRNG
jgi:hypothetical protein